MSQSYRFVVSGRVQGVFFRQSAVNEATALGLTGWVRNRADGCVEGVAQGPGPALDRFRAWLGHGPPEARVGSVEWTAAEPEAAAGFAARR